MSKRGFSPFSVLFLVIHIVLLIGCTQVRIFQMADNYSDYVFATYVEHNTNGAVIIEIQNISDTHQKDELVKMVQTGEIAFARAGIAELSSINPMIGVLNMPFFFENREDMFRVLDGSSGDELLELFVENNLLGLCWFDTGFRNIYTSGKEIKTPSDLAGLKIRVEENPLMMDVFRFLGAFPLPMAADDVAENIQKRIINGAEGTWHSYITSGHYEAAKYYSLIQFMSAPDMLLVNTDVWNSFNETEKKIIKEAALEMAKVQRESWLAAEQEYEALARAAGCVITEPTPANIQLFADALALVYELHLNGVNHHIIH